MKNFGFYGFAKLHFYKMAFSDFHILFFGGAALEIWLIYKVNNLLIKNILSKIKLMYKSFLFSKLRSNKNRWLVIRTKNICTFLGKLEKPSLQHQLLSHHLKSISYKFDLNISNSKISWILQMKIDDAAKINMIINDSITVTLK